MNFKGIRRTPSMASEGESDYMINLMPQEGELRTIPQMEPLGVELAEGERLLCVHHIGSSVHYIVCDGEGTGLAWYDIAGSRTSVCSFGSPVEEVAPMGNVLVVRTAEGSATRYLVWSPPAGSEGNPAYVALSEGFPRLDLQFRLRNMYVQTFHKGAETGITLQEADFQMVSDFSQTVAPTPVQTPEFRGDYSYVITPSAPLERSTTYKVECRRLTGKVLQTLRIYVTYDDQTEVMEGEGTVRLWDDDLTQPYAVFTTDAAKTAVAVRVAFSPTNSRKNVSYTLVLLKGTAASAGIVFADTEENFNALMGVANRFVARQATKKNLFMYPFFARYALRLYDGSCVCPSAPCLMMPNVGLAPYVWTYGGESGKAWDTYVSAVVSQLKFRVLQSEGLEAWKPFIRSVAFAVSSPVWSYRQEAGWAAGQQLVTVGRADLSDVEASGDTWSYGYFDDGDGTCSASYLFKKHNALTDLSEVYALRLPSYSKEQMAQSLQERSLFYVVKELPLDELPADDSWQDVAMEEGTLESLETRERLDDNSLTLTGRSGQVMTVYNSRLVMAGLTERLFKGYMPVELQGQSGYLVNDRSSSARGVIQQTKAIVRYVSGGQPHTLCRRDLSGYANNGPFCWFYYPSANAKSAVIWQLRDLTVAPRWRRAELALRPHPYLTGAYWFDNFREPDWTDWAFVSSLDDPQLLEEYNMLETDAVVSSENKIMQSEANNPFLFRAGLTNEVGNSCVVALAAATHALSEGQFGQFPLYAFCHDGIWALSVGGDGAFTAVHPLSRDRCTSRRSIVPLDHAIAFATAQGLKLLSGSSVRTLSSRLEGWTADTSLLRGVDPSFDGLVADVGQEFNRHVADCTMAYDYPNQLLHIYPGSAGYHYVLCLQSGEFTLSSDQPSPAAVVNAWPDTVVQDGTALHRFSRTCSAASRPGLFLSRPMAFKDLTGLKRLNDLRVIWQQLSDDSSVRVAAFASNDRRRWWRMPSLASHSYRWFRIALFTRLNDFERIESLQLTV